MLTINPCRKCGVQPPLISYRASEDSEACRVQCQCGEQGDEIEDAYVDEGMKVDAVRAWNQQN